MFCHNYLPNVPPTALSNYQQTKNCLKTIDSRLSCLTFICIFRRYHCWNFGTDCDRNFISTFRETTPYFGIMKSLVKYGIIENTNGKPIFIKGRMDKDHREASLLKLSPLDLSKTQQKPITSFV